jgi:hypothetical protein
VFQQLVLEALQNVDRVIFALMVSFSDGCHIPVELRL